MENELKEYLENHGAVGGIIKTQHERDFYKKKYEEAKEENEAWCAMDGGDGDEVFGNRLWSLLYEKKLCPTSYGEAVGYIKDLFEENK